MIEKFVAFTEKDAVAAQQFELVFNNTQRLLSKVFTLAITEVKFALLRAQDWPLYRGWIFKFKDLNCWFGVSLSGKSFLALRFHVQIEEEKENIFQALKDQGLQQFSWLEGGGKWLWKEQASGILELSDKDEQIRVCTDILKENLFAIEGVL